MITQHKQEVGGSINMLWNYFTGNTPRSIVRILTFNEREAIPETLNYYDGTKQILSNHLYYHMSRLYDNTN